MTRTLRSGLAALAVAFFAAHAAAQEPIRLARTPDVSPDGKLVAFSYLGDIWVVETIGGTARQVTSHPAHDLNPVFSPDGRQLAFSSNRHGSYDVFVVPLQGGRPRRLTFDSANDYVCGWSPDGKNVLFTSTRSTDFPPAYELFTVPVEGGRVSRVTKSGAKEGVYSPSGDRIAYTRGPGTWYRKGYRGSANDDVWVCDADGTHNRRLTAFNGQDSSPMWGADGNTLYYVSEFHGTANVVRQPLAAAGAAVAPVKPQPITFHKDDSVRRARISRDGNWIVYECGPDLWVVGTRDGSQPRKLAVAVYADDKTNPERVETFTGRATEFALTHDEKFVAFAVHGKLFRLPVSAKGARPVQMTDGPSNDHGIAWAPDGSKIIFVSDRGGRDDLYLLEANDPEHPKFTEAHRFKVTQLTNTPEAEFGVSFAPNGRRVAFVRAGKLWTMGPDGKDQKTVVDDVNVIDYEWSPDSRWLVYARRDGSFASELFIVPAGGPTAADPPRNVTRYATFNAGVTWSADGKKLAFLSERSERAGVTYPYVMDLQKPAAPGYTERPALALGGPAVSIDWEDVHLRTRSAAPMPTDEVAISPDGSKVAFRGHTGGSDLWVASTTGHQVTRLTTGNQRPHHIQWSKRKSAFGGGYMDLLYFLDGGGNLRVARTSAGPTGSGELSATLPFKIKMTIKNEELYDEMFDQTWRYLAEHFYDAKFHGRDWAAVRARYRPLVKHVAVKEDLYALLHLMMGELNASHLGVSGFTSAPDETTADLGLIFDEDYRGRGLKVKEVLKRGPADRRGLAIKAGDVVTAIDGVEITPKVDVSKLLNGKENEPVVVQVTSNPAADPKKDPRAYRRYEIQAAPRSRVAQLMYDRWVERNATRVRELSKGKLGYIHIPSMDEEGLDKFVRSLYSDNFDKEAIVLDVRYNGGGFTHDQVLNYLAGREHTFFRQRDGGQGLVLRSNDRKWTRPLVLLINNRSYSDAEIFPSAFRTMGLGKLVGEPTAGSVIGTGSTRLIDGSVLRVPRIGVYTARGVNMEREGVQPDVLVEPHPDQLARGVDAQLDKAVEVLEADVVAWKKKNHPAVAVKPEDGKPGAPTPPVTPLIPK
jgi:tricorn protease